MGALVSLVSHHYQDTTFRYQIHKPRWPFINIRPFLHQTIGSHSSIIPQRRNFWKHFAGLVFGLTKRPSNVPAAIKLLSGPIDLRHDSQQSRLRVSGAEILSAVLSPFHTGRFTLTSDTVLCLPLDVYTLSGPSMSRPWHDEDLCCGCAAKKNALRFLRIPSPGSRDSRLSCSIQFRFKFTLGLSRYLHIIGQSIDMHLFVSVGLGWHASQNGSLEDSLSSLVHSGDGIRCSFISTQIKPEDKDMCRLPMSFAYPTRQKRGANGG